ncbi:hypothetical protein [Hufsiella ginkgonis]|uniref:Uncharacterized protein n=1 Tax=Hufsiella ginkgonis TaxID=2695274 RepID=A0A7K1Y019_9SPHI|nr:hypothetical protein [Hufsiella ginkgonis]MXV16339.1 hypothetical protein [Hufsiella ginkgonis]
MAILVTSGTGAAAFRVERLLQTREKVIFGDHEGFPLPAFPAGKFIRIPGGKSNTFIHDLLDLCLDLGITEVYALRRDELTPLAEGKQLFLEFGIHVFVPSTEILQMRLLAGPVPGNDIQIRENGLFVQDASTGDYSVFTAD